MGLGLAALICFAGVVGVLAVILVLGDLGGPRDIRRPAAVRDLPNEEDRPH